MRELKEYLIQPAAKLDSCVVIILIYARRGSLARKNVEDLVFLFSFTKTFSFTWNFVFESLS